MVSLETFNFFKVQSKEGNMSVSRCLKQVTGFFLMWKFFDTELRAVKYICVSVWQVILFYSVMNLTYDIPPVMGLKIE